MKSLTAQLQTRYRMLECTRLRIEKLYQENSIIARDLKSLYSGLFINIVTEFEGFLEDQFIPYLSGCSTSAKPRVKIQPKSVAYDILRGERSYVDWLPYRYLTKRADRFFEDGHAFSNLDRDEKRILDKISIIRNAIAHNSAHANELFKKEILVDVHLRPKEKNPIEYLRKSFQQNIVYFQYYSLFLLSCSNKIAN